MRDQLLIACVLIWFMDAIAFAGLIIWTAIANAWEGHEDRAGFHRDHS